MLLGTAALHLSRFSGGMPHKVAESYHWGSAIKLFKKELTSQIADYNIDALISTSMLLSSLVYSVEEYDPADSWVFSSDPTALNWLLMQSGIGYILAYSVPYIEQSIWRRALMIYHDEYQLLDNHDPGREGLHSGLADLCEINETTTENDNPYHWPLRLLSPLLELQPTRENFDKLNTFVGGLSPKFKSLLIQKDSKALVIFSYW